MDATFLTAVWQAIGDYWPYIAGGSVPVLGGIATAILAFLRRPKSFSEGDQTYLDDEKLLSPPLRRPAYSDRMAYVLAELSDLAYYQFEGANGFINDAIEQAKRIDLTDESNIREFLDGFSAEMMSGHRLSLNAFSGILERSGFSLLRTINVGETQGFVSKRTAPGEPPYVVLAFRGTEKKISDCSPTCAAFQRSRVRPRSTRVFSKRSPRRRTPQVERHSRWSKIYCRETTPRKAGSRFPCS